jgi:SAM-dependent methyltransferase
MQEVKYIHGEHYHNLQSPKEIVPVLMDLVAPRSVVDIGCGIGTFLYCFKEAGVEKVLGVDGSWVNRDLLHKYIQPGEFREHDLEKLLQLDMKYDLAICLEVAEHLKPEAADTMVENLVKAGNIILFSAAVPQQGGQNHLNEQWPSYWENKFRKHGYRMHDFLKPVFWNNPKVFFWYKQNMVFFAPEGYQFTGSHEYNQLNHVIHPDMFTNNITELNQQLDHIRNGEMPPYNYFKYLVKSIIGKKYSGKLRKFVK